MLKRGLTLGLLSRLDRIDLLLAELAAFQCALARFLQRDRYIRAETHIAVTALHFVRCGIANNFTCRHVALRDPVAEDPRLRAVRRDLQIEAAAVAVEARPLLARYPHCAEFSDDRRECAPNFYPLLYP